jgi:hypothetical protein
MPLVLVRAFVAFTYRFGKVLSGLQPTFELQYGGTINLTSVKTTRKLVSVALEVRIIKYCSCIKFVLERETWSLSYSCNLSLI